MIVFQDKFDFNRFEVSKEETSVSTLLIPEYLMLEFFLKTKKNKGNVSLYLHSLLRRFRSITHTGLLPEPNKIKTEYQEKKLNLKKISFRPKNADWIELGEIAHAFGKSRCWVFTYLLKLDLLNLWSTLVEAKLNKVVPTLSTLELNCFSNLERVLDRFARGYWIRV